jgi:cytochrome P450
MVTALNFADPKFLEDPFPFYEMGRRMSPLYLDQQGMWLVFGYNDIQAILKDNGAWGSAFTPPPGTENAPPPSLLGSDPPRHTRLRALVSQAFTPRMVELLEPRIRQIAADLLDPILAGGKADIVDALSYPLPVIVIAEILGVPPEDRAMFKRWSNEVVATLGGGIENGGRDIAEATFEAMRSYFEKMTDERRANPRNDLISGLVQAELDGEKLNFQELLQMLILLLVAGNETTTNLIGNSVIEFMNHPDQLAKVEADRSLVPVAIEEVLRYSSPVQATVRRAARTQEVGGKTIEQGRQAVVWLAAGNRDPEIFEDPATFHVTRNPNRHLSFGHGIHFCLGAPLARLEAKVAIEELLKRAKDFHRTDNDPLPRVPTFIMRGVRALPIGFSAR